jgi:two-component system sensor histidine kinase/response regulator
MSQSLDGAERPMKPPLPGANVLVVDDTIENLQLLSSMLSEHGYEVRPVTNGQQALQAARSYPPGVVLLDIKMPEMDGYEVCRHLKQTEELREIPVIFVTALGSSIDKVKAFEAGGADYVTKPFQVDEVLARVKVQMALRESRRQLVESFERLRELERLRDDLVQMVIHDMRSPLAALMTLLELVQRDASCKLGKRAAEDLQYAVQTAATVNRLANDVLDVSRLEEDKLPIERKLNDVVTICREVSAPLQALDRRRRIVVDATNAVEAPCDRDIVRRVLENLVSNAIKHTPTGGQIRISVVRDEAGVRVSVHDQGAGVPPEARSRIFEKFGTAECRNDQVYHSAGLGLTFCKLAVEAHGGQIGVDSAEPTGSIFWFVLPASER